MSTKKSTAKKVGSPTKIAPAALAPEIKVPKQQQLYWFWVGALPSAPRASIDVGGVSFPKILESVHRSTTLGKTKRTQHAGCLVKLSRAKLELIAARLRSKVFRFEGARQVDDIEHPGMLNLDGRYPRNNALELCIPTEEEIEAAKKRGRHLRPYIASDRDRPVSEFIYLQYVGEKKPKQRAIDADLPKPLSKTGIVFPPKDAKPVSASAQVSKGASVFGAELAPRSKPHLPEIDAARKAQERALVDAEIDNPVEAHSIEGETLEQYAERTRANTETVVRSTDAALES